MEKYIANGLTYSLSNGILTLHGLKNNLNLMLIQEIKDISTDQIVFQNNITDNLVCRCSFEYILVLDFEANCVEGNTINPQEIIEFPVVPISVLRKEVLLDRLFHSYVDTEYTKLTPFCTQLTGITQKHIKGKPKLAEIIVKLDQ